MNKENRLLPLNLQFFGGEGKQETDEIDETTPPAEAQTTETDGEEETKKVDTKIPYDRFKAKVDEVNALKEELDKIKEQQEAQKTKELEDQQKYKELYEQAQETIRQQKADALKAKKISLLASAGYDEDKTNKLLKLVEGETDEEIKSSIEELKGIFPTKPNYVDPSAGNGRRDIPEQVDGEVIGRELFDRLFKSGKIKGFKNN